MSDPAGRRRDGWLLRSWPDGVVDTATRAIVGPYFEVSYGLLASAAGRSFLEHGSGSGQPAVHGYSTRDDLDALVAALRPGPEDVIADLGCGTGGAALEVHRRTGCRVVGIDASRRAIRAARRRARREGSAASVRFVHGDLASATVVASAAYALDSLMFVRRPEQVLAGRSHALDPPGRVFATLVDGRRMEPDRLRETFESAGLRVERLEDVTAAMRERSRARARLAGVLVGRSRRWRDRLAMRLILAEEAVMTRLIDRGRIRRWRLVVGPARARR